MKVVINACYGGFGLSEAAVKRLKAEGIEDPDHWDLCRHDPRLIRAVEEMGAEASAYRSNLTVVAAEGDRYYIEEYDGFETLLTPEDPERWIVVT